VSTPRRTRLVRTPDLAAVRTFLLHVAQSLAPLDAPDTFVLVPTRAAGEQLRRTLEDRLLTPKSPTAVLPWIGTRDDLYDLFARRLPARICTLTAYERDALVGAAARAAEESAVRPPFDLRPALVAEMLGLYDYIRRQQRTVDDFDRLVAADLEAAAESDRGAEQLLEQTRFLVAAFNGYDRRLADSDLYDEHTLRAHLLATAPDRPVRHVVVTVGDRLSDAHGLWPADIALLTAIPGLERIDVVSTVAALDAGHLDRLRLSFVDIGETTYGAPQASPTLVVRPGEGVGGEQELLFEYRDRENELEAVAKRIKTASRTGDAAHLHRTALVVARPLPYLYLAREVFGNAGIPFEVSDTLPLAAEPYAAAVDLVLEFVASDFTRGAATALLRSPHFAPIVDDAGVESSAITALDFAFAEARYLGGLSRLETLVADWSAIDAPRSREERRRKIALPAARAALNAATILSPLQATRPLIDQTLLLQQFLERSNRDLPDGSETAARRNRTREAVRSAIDGLAAAFQRHDSDAVGTVNELRPALRHWLSASTFATRTGESGIQLIDPQAARFGEFDDVQVMGLVQGEWPDMQPRNLFYPASLLALLEPTRPERIELNQERDRLRASRAVFHDLLHLAARRTRVSTFALEADSVVERSVLADELSASGLTRETDVGDRPVRVFAHEGLVATPPSLDHLSPATTRWARARLARRERDASRFQGQAGAWILPRVSVSRIEGYLKCPFQFFASNVLRLEEEPGDEDTRTPLERGRFLHELFESFFREWQRRGHGRITGALVGEARQLFEHVSEQALGSLGPADAALERASLLGSAAGSGIGERVFGMEAERDVEIRERLLEYPLEGEFSFAKDDRSTRLVSLGAKIDRVDLLADGTFRLIDYKTKYVPDRKVALQLPIYSACVRQRLSQDRERPIALSEAMYLSFEGDKPITKLAQEEGSFDPVIADAEHRLSQALDDIAAGRFPQRPAPKSICNMCAFVTVCREPGGVEASTELTGSAGAAGSTGATGSKGSPTSTDGGGSNSNQQNREPVAPEEPAAPVEPRSGRE
jgi:RecB family exonuclease